jgi:hypothetical protein
VLGQRLGDGLTLALTEVGLSPVDEDLRDRLALGELRGTMIILEHLL